MFENAALNYLRQQEAVRPECPNSSNGNEGTKKVLNSEVTRLFIFHHNLMFVSLLSRDQNPKTRFGGGEGLRGVEPNQLSSVDAELIQSNNHGCDQQIHNDCMLF